MGSGSFVVFSGVSVLAGSDGAVDRDGAVLRLTADRRIPLVLCSGRTRAELEFAQRAAGLAHPFVAEHGGAAFVRDGYFPDELMEGTRRLVGYAAMEFGRPYPQIVELLRRASARARVEVVGFSDMSVDEVAVECRLPLLQARLAKLRDYEEAFRMVDAEPGARTRLWRALQSAQLGCLTDGHLDFVGAPVDFAVGVHWVASLYRRVAGPTVTIGIGDKPHHVPMLRRVDVPIVASGDPVAARQLAAALPRGRAVELQHRASLPDALQAIFEQRAPSVALS